MAKPNEPHKDDSAPVAIEVSATDARNRMGDLLDGALGGKRFRIMRNGKTVGALVSAQDLALLDAAS